MAFLGLIPEVKGDVQLKLSAADAQREAIGKALSLVGATIGITGTIMALSANPAFKSQAEGVWAKAPKSVQDNKMTALILMGLLGAGAAYWFIKRSVENQNKARYQ